MNLVELYMTPSRKTWNYWIVKAVFIKKNDMYAKLIKSNSDILLSKSRLVDHAQQEERNSINFNSPHNFSSTNSDGLIDIRWMGQ